MRRNQHRSDAKRVLFGAISNEGQRRVSVFTAQRHLVPALRHQPLQAHLDSDHGASISSLDFDLLNHYLAQVLLVNNVTFAFLECPFTQQWLAAMHRGYSVPFHTTLTRDLMPQECASLLQQMKKKLSQIPWLCLEFDGWSSKVVRGYLGIVVHGIDEACKLQSFFLALKHVTMGNQ